MDAQEVLLLRAAREHAATGSGRNIRVNARLSLHDVAAAISVAPGVLSRWETGQRRPRTAAGPIRWAAFLNSLIEQERTTLKPAV